MDKYPIDELVSLFIEKGGRINKYYLQNTSRSKPSLVYFNGWHRGNNIREAILKAMGDR
jgi:hypothetical protein